MAARIPTRVNAIAQKIAPLVDFYKKNNPTCRTIDLYHTDWLFLVKSPLANIRPMGFNITAEGGLTYGVYTLRPIKVSATKEKQST